METPLTVEALLASFPCKEHDIANILGEPDRITLNALFKAIRRNATSIYSDKGGGQYGHLDLTMAPTAYTALQHGSVFILETHPGVLTFAEAYKRSFNAKTRATYTTGRNTPTLLNRTSLSPSRA